MDTKLTCRILSFKKVLEFVVFARLTTSPEDRLLEPSFYSNGVPDGDHHELEIVLPKDWSGAKNAKIIHFHISPKGRPFVCWIGHLPTLEEAEEMFKTWCLGTAFAMKTGEDFATIYLQEPSTFQDRMAGRRFAVLDCVSEAA